MNCSFVSSRTSMLLLCFSLYVFPPVRCCCCYYSVPFNIIFPAQKGEKKMCKKIVHYRDGVLRCL